MTDKNCGKDEKCGLFCLMNVTEAEIEQMVEMLFKEYRARYGKLKTDNYSISSKTLFRREIKNHAKQCTKYAELLGKIRKKQ